MTVAERENAAIFIRYTNVKPFIFMGTSFKCFFCVKYYPELIELLEHTNTHYIIDDIEVIVNKYIPKGKRTIQVDSSKLQCRVCNANYPDLDKIKGHLQSSHEIKFAAASNGMTEYKMEVIDGFIKCHICNEKFLTYTEITSHVNSHVGKVVCETCGKGFLNQHLLKKHREKHFIMKFDCELCDQVFLKQATLKYHMNYVHKGKNRVRMQKCPECNEMFKEYYGKQRHMREVHGVQKTFHCTFCRRPFGTRRALTEHTTQVHTEKFKCEVCSQCFGIKSKLKLHMRSHSGEKNFKCPICNNAYMHEITLKQHLISHDAVQV